MSEKHLHIVSFNIPFPANYGGIIDVYFKMKALHELGVKVHLHCFQYGREEAAELHEVCETVNYYPRQQFFKSIYSSVPYIVGSRQSNELLPKLVDQKYPIIFEGLHTCFYLGHPELKDRVKAVRMHNIEWDYYRHLGKAERGFFRKFYFFTESFKLKNFETQLNFADLVLAISPNDTAYLKEKYDGRVHYIPAFHPHQQVESLPGLGEYALYHGNLEVVENNQAAVYIIEKIFKEIDYKLIIAGKNPLPILQKLAAKYPNVELKANVDDAEMDILIKNAHVNLLPTFQPTGIKLKLLNALYNGRYCLVNKPMVSQTGLEELCVMAESAEEMKNALPGLFKESFGNGMIAKRQQLLDQGFSNRVNAQKIIQLIYSQNQ